jgi:hypothetical protein
MKRLSYVLAAAAVAAVAFFSRPVLAGDPAPSAPAATPAKAAPAEAPKVEAPKTEAPKTEAAKSETKTPSPIHSMMGWLGKQVAPNLECGCPSTAEGEKAWRAWFAGGKDVPAAAIRDALVADGWTADRVVSFFQAMAKANAGSCEGGKCADGKCAEGKCAEGKCNGGACGEKKDGCCGDCKDKAKSETPADKPTDKPAETQPKS